MPAPEGPARLRQNDGGTRLHLGGVLDEDAVAVGPAVDLLVAPRFGRVHSVEHDLLTSIVNGHDAPYFGARRGQQLVLLDGQVVVGSDVEGPIDAFLEGGGALPALSHEDGGNPGGRPDDLCLRLVLGGEPSGLTLELQRDGEGPPDAPEPGAMRAGLREDPHQALAPPLARHLDEPEGAEVEDLGALTIALQCLLECLHDAIAVALALHIDEVYDDDSAEVAQPELAGYLFRRLYVGVEDGVFQPGRPGVAAGVDVDGCERLRLIDADVAADVEPDLAPEQTVDLAFDPVLVEDGQPAAVELDALAELRCNQLDEFDGVVVGAFLVDHQPTDILAEDVADDLVDESEVLVQQGRPLGARRFLHQPIPKVEQHLEVRLQILSVMPLGFRADDNPAVFGSDLACDASQPVPLLSVLDLARDTALGSLREQQDEIPPRQGEARRGAGALAGDGSAHDLHHDFLLLLEPLGDGGGSRGGTDGDTVAAHESHVVGAEEDIAIDADIGEGGVHSPEDALDASLVDAPHDSGFALDVELCEVTVLNNGDP